MSRALATSEEPAYGVDLRPDTPVLRDVTIAEDTPAKHLSRFADDVWFLYPMALKPTGAVTRLTFANCPTEFTTTAKRLVWCLINCRTPVELLERPNRVASRPTAANIIWLYGTELRPFLEWLATRDLRRLSDVDGSVLRSYSADVSSRAITWPRKARLLLGVSRVWLLAPYLPPADRLCRPPWEQPGDDTWLGPPQWTGENKTRPVHPQTMSPLLLWSLRFVQDLSDDILRALGERRRMDAVVSHRAQPGDAERTNRWIDELRAAGGALPGWRNWSGRLVVANTYLAARIGVGRNAVLKLSAMNLPVVAGAPLACRIDGRIEGQPWIDHLDFYEVDQLASLLAVACFVVVAYLSGMRSEECRALTRGCCARVDLGDGAAGYQLVGRTFKGVVDDHGNTIPGGTVRDQPWHVVAPVADAIGVIERLHGGRLLFSRAALSPTGRGDPERSADGSLIRDRIDALITWCNSAAQRLDRPHEAIPDDPDGPITVSRFRRTLAWFIYRLPTGRIALGIQYGHLEGRTTDGYGSRAEAGLKDVFPMEEAFALADTLGTAADRLDAGEGVSGPAAPRYLAGVAEFAAGYRGRYLTPSQGARLRRDSRLRIVDNGAQPLACCYEASKALCHPDRDRRSNPDRSPDLTRCDPRCGNVARTDTHIDRVRSEIAELEVEMASPLVPEPIRLRLGQRVEMLTAVVELHERTRMTAATNPSQASQ